MRLIPVITLSLVLLLLATYGAGIFPWTLLVAALALLSCLCPWQACSSSAPKKRALAAWPLALLLAYMVLMSLPLPSGLTRFSGPRRAQQNQVVMDTFADIHTSGLALHAPPLFSISRSRAGTLRLLLLMITAYAGWAIIRQTPARQREHWLRGLVWLAAAMSAAGLAGKYLFPQGDSLWWWIPIPHGRPGPMGGFMNRNHFAGFMALLAPAALGLGLHDLDRRRRPLAGAIHLAAAGVLMAGVLFSLSRGGLVALAAGLVTLLVVETLRRRPPVRIGLVAGTLLLALAFNVAYTRSPALRERVQTLRTPAGNESLQHRADAWRDTLRIWRHYPLLGAGPNAFRVVYPQHRTTSRREARDFAENEYVQAIGETGLAGIFIALCLAGSLLHRANLALRETPPAPRVLPLAAITALAVAATHALVDFPLHLPLYTLTLAAITGLLWPHTESPVHVPAPACHPVWAAGGLLIILALLPADLQLDTAGRLGSADIHTTAKALTAAPTSPVAWRRLAALLEKQDMPDASRLAERCLTQAAAYDPNNYVLWRHLGDKRRDQGNLQGANAAYRHVRELRDWVKLPTLPEEN